MQESWEGWRGRESFSRSPMEERECRKTTSGSNEQVRKKGAFYRPHKNIAVGSLTPESPAGAHRSIRPGRILRRVSGGYSGLRHGARRIRLVSGRSPIWYTGSCHTRQLAALWTRPESPTFTRRSVRCRRTGVSAGDTPESPGSRLRAGNNSDQNCNNSSIRTPNKMKPILLER